MRDKMRLTMNAIAENEYFARVTVAAFSAKMDPTMEELSDIKTAVSEAVTNAVVHGYDGKGGSVEIRAEIQDEWLEVEIEDDGIGMDDVKLAMEPLYTSRPETNHAGMGFTFMEAFMDELEVTSTSGQGTKVKMRKKIERPAVLRSKKSARQVTDVREQLQRAQAGDKEARNYLVQENIGLVKHIVSRYTARGVEKEDLFQIGMIGLLKAIDYFDLSYDVRFSTYAVPMIAGEIRRFMRDNGAIKVSRSIKDNRAAVNRSREQLLEKLGREPTLSEIVKDVGMSMEDVLLAVNSGQEVASLQQTIYDGDGSSIRLMDKLSARSGEGDAALDRMMLADSLSALDQREREIIVLRFYYDQTQSQIAKRMGVSQVQVSRLEKRILRKMKMYIC